MVKMAPTAALLKLMMVATSLGSDWRICDVTSAEFGARGDGVKRDSEAIRAALAACNHVVLLSTL